MFRLGIASTKSRRKAAVPTARVRDHIQKHLTSFETHTLMISFVSCAALRSRSLKSDAFLSSLVVYAPSSNTALTPNSFSLTAN